MATPPPEPSGGIRDGQGAVPDPASGRRRPGPPQRRAAGPVLSSFRRGPGARRFAELPVLGGNTGPRSRPLDVLDAGTRTPGGRAARPPVDDAAVPEAICHHDNMGVMSAYG
ncbi:hypothetical protein GCM10010421_48110 [Streptomyces glaucus]|uniref:Uncharacterized protein n=1 Tax=Streptomyces glaucus TaxID=284029 RepID=A0ABN3K5M3_9ACTN